MRPLAGGSTADPHLLETSLPGVFVAGDVRSESMKRVASAVGEGSMAVHFVHEYLATVGCIDLREIDSLSAGVEQGLLDDFAARATERRLAVGDHAFRAGPARPVPT